MTDAREDRDDNLFSDEIWKCIEELESKEQIFLLRKLLQDREPIHRFSDIKEGDHLIRKGSSPGTGLFPYEHHFICTGFDSEGRPTIIHYYNTAANARSQMAKTSGFGSGTANEKFAIVQVMTLQEDYIENEDELQAKGKEVERVVWPEELRRFSVRDVISRAKEREGEKFYDLNKNNCESFVMWCLCGLNISLQVTSGVKAFCHTASGVVRSIWHFLQQVFKVGADLIADKATAITRQAIRGAFRQAARKALSLRIGIGVGAAVTVVIEAIMAVYDIYTANKKRKGGVFIKSREEFIKEVTDIVLLALFRSGGSIVGMVVGQIVIPIPVVGGLVGAVVGVFGGHLLGKLVTKSGTKKLAHFIDSKISNTTTEEGV